MIQGDTIDIPKVPKKMLHHCQNLNKIVYRISPNKRRAPNMRNPPISATPLGIHIKISAPPPNKRFPPKKRYTPNNDAY